MGCHLRCERHDRLCVHVSFLDFMLTGPWIPDLSELHSLEQQLMCVNPSNDQLVDNSTQALRDQNTADGTKMSAKE